MAVVARPAGIWTRVVDYVSKGSLLKIEVVDPTAVRRSDPDTRLEVPMPGAAGKVDSRTWQYASESSCGPDGDYSSNLTISSLINEKAPVGALIGKVGGSTAAKDDGVLVFCVGSFCVLRLSESQEGPLFLTINDSPKGFHDNDGEMIISVFEGI